MKRNRNFKATTNTIYFTGHVEDGVSCTSEVLISLYCLERKLGEIRSD